MSMIRSALPALLILALAAALPAGLAPPASAAAAAPATAPAPQAGAEAPPAPHTYLTLTSPAGKARLARSRYAADYLPLSVTFTTQVRQTLCSVATGVTVLNALPVARPVDPVYAPYAYFTQTNYFNDAVSRIRSREQTLTDGMTLDMAAAALRAHGARATAHHAEDGTLQEFRDRARENLARDGDFVIVNYQRQVIGQPRGAHFSPLGAYDAATDTFLVLDVARYKFPPVWLRAADLFEAMSTRDSEIPRSRGYILVSAP